MCCPVALMDPLLLVSLGLFTYPLASLSEEQEMNVGRCHFRGKVSRGSRKLTTHRPDLSLLT